MSFDFAIRSQDISANHMVKPQNISYTKINRLVFLKYKGRNRLRIIFEF